MITSDICGSGTHERVEIKLLIRGQLRVFKGRCVEQHRRCTSVHFKHFFVPSHMDLVHHFYSYCRCCHYQLLEVSSDRPHLDYTYSSLLFCPKTSLTKQSGAPVVMLSTYIWVQNWEFHWVTHVAVLDQQDGLIVLSSIPWVQEFWDFFCLSTSKDSNKICSHLLKALSCSIPYPHIGFPSFPV